MLHQVLQILIEGKVRVSPQLRASQSLCEGEDNKQPCAAHSSSPSREIQLTLGEEVVKPRFERSEAEDAMVR